MPQGSSRRAGVAVMTRTLGLLSLLTSLFEGEVHLVPNHLALRVEALEDLRQHIHCLLAAQPRLLGLELLQQVLCGHGLPGQVAAHSILCHLDITEGKGRRLGSHKSPFSPILPMVLLLSEHTRCWAWTSQTGSGDLCPSEDAWLLESHLSASLEERIMSGPGEARVRDTSYAEG